MRIVRIIFKTAVYLAFLVIFVGMLLEVVYRYQLVEFYAPEFSALNKEREQELKSDSNKKVLVIGDSFSASAHNYVDHLRKLKPDWYILNAAIPGTGIRQHEIILKKRIRNFKPDILVYQFYIGNDLTDVIHPYQSHNISFLRSIYWRLSDHILVLPYINSRLTFLRKRKSTIELTSNSDLKFDVNTYNNRTRLYIQAKPDVYSSSILLEGDMLKSYNIWSNHFNDLLESLPPSCKVYVIVLPHCLQTSEYYLNNFAELGAEVSSDLLNNEYPLINRMRKDHADVIFLNPLSYFQESPWVNSIYYSVDPHLSDHGQQVLYDFLDKKIDF